MAQLTKAARQLLVGVFPAAVRGNISQLSSLSLILIETHRAISNPAGAQRRAASSGSWHKPAIPIEFDGVKQARVDDKM